MDQVGVGATAAVRDRPGSMTGPWTARNDEAAIPMAVAQPVADLVMGPLRSATILAAHSAAVVLCVEQRGPASSKRAVSGLARVITVLTRQASGVPNGARTALSADEAPFRGICSSDSAFVGAGCIALPGLRLRVVRTIRTGVPHIGACPQAVARIAATARSADTGVPDEPVAEFREALDAGDPSRLRSAVRALVGLGHGSTPGGDDVLAGTLAGLLATRRDVLAGQIAAAALPDLTTRTPLMSADLLRLAAAGHVCTEADAVLRAADAVGHGAAAADLDRALATLLAVGATSGADLATGLAIGLGVAPQPVPRRPRQSRRGSTVITSR